MADDVFDVFMVVGGNRVVMGSAIKGLDGFTLQFRDMAMAPATARPAATGGAVFPPYGRSKGMPVAGASAGDLDYYASGCQRTLDDPAKARWHDKERALLDAIRAEQAKSGGYVNGGQAKHTAPIDDSEVPF